MAVLCHGRIIKLLLLLLLPVVLLVLLQLRLPQTAASACVQSWRTVRPNKCALQPLLHQRRCLSLRQAGLPRRAAVTVMGQQQGPCQAHSPAHRRPRWCAHGGQRRQLLPPAQLLGCRVLLLLLLLRSFPSLWRSSWTWRWCWVVMAPCCGHATYLAIGAQPHAMGSIALLLCVLVVLSLYVAVCVYVTVPWQ